MNIAEKITKAPHKIYDLSDDDDSDEELKMFNKSKQNQKEIIEDFIPKAPRKAYDLSDDESEEELKIFKNIQIEESENTEGFFDFMPEEVILKIMTHLNFHELILMRNVSKLFLRICSDVTLVKLTTKQMETIETMLNAPNHGILGKSFEPKTTVSCGVGTGKTIIALHLIKRMIEAGTAKKILIMVPDSLLYEWKKAFAKWCTGLPTLCEFHSGIKHSDDIFLDSESVVLTKNGLQVGAFVKKYDAGCPVETDFNISGHRAYKGNKHIAQQIGSQKWDLIIVDDMQSTPASLRAFVRHLVNIKHPFKLFNLNASDNRKKNLVNYGVDEELPDKPDIDLNIYSIKIPVYTGLHFYYYCEKDRALFYENSKKIILMIKNIVDKSNSKNSFLISSNIDKSTSIAIRENFCPDYYDLNGCSNQNKIKILQKFETNEITKIYSQNSSFLMKGHNLYPEEITMIIGTNMSHGNINNSKTISLSDIYQALGRAHRVFSPNKKIKFNVFVIFKKYNKELSKMSKLDINLSSIESKFIDFNFTKLKAFFLEYLNNPDQNFKKICQRLQTIQMNRNVINKLHTTSNIKDSLNTPKIDSFEFLLSISNEKDFENIEYDSHNEESIHHIYMSLKNKKHIQFFADD